MKFLLDTNVISEIRKRERANPGVLRWVRETEPEDIAISVLVLAELRRGIKSKRRSDAVQAGILDEWFTGMREGLGSRGIPIDEPIAEAWAGISAAQTLPVIDGLLASTALVRGMTRVTRNIAYVKRTGVKLLNPFAAR